MEPHQLFCEPGAPINVIQELSCLVFKVHFKWK